MAWALFSVRGDDDARVEDGEIMLGEPDKAESESLVLHTDKCARRYRVTILRLNRLDHSVARATLLLWIVLAALVVQGGDKIIALLKLAVGL